MPRATPPPTAALIPRREFLARCGMGFGTLGLASLLAENGAAATATAAAPTASPLVPRAPHFTGRAKRVIHFFLNGGPSHVDTFDPKPALAVHAGRALPYENLRTERKTGMAFPTPFKFAPHGRSGLEISDIFPNIARHADELAVVRSMHAEVPNHEPSLMLMNCGDSVQSRPSVGAWVTYGLGSENQNLPAFIVMCPRGFPIKDADNWSAGFLPGVFQGTFIDSQFTQLDKLIENIRSGHATLKEQRQQLDLLARLNSEHLAARGRDSLIEARIQSFELAYRMQMEAADAFDVTREPEHVRAMYGEGIHARQTLIARRLLERGVRFIQLWHGAGQPWDNHENIQANHSKLAKEIDQPIGALIADLKQRGMLDETLILFGGEFGRTPTVELNNNGTSKLGRDHNHYGFSVWMAGGGVKGGTAYGATDEFGFKAVENKASVHDLHATMLHLLGFDHERLTYRYAGRDFRLTDVSGNVMRELVA
ncbi:MAG: DUF1501 domain-containing protein [Verrucomicrobia bacterium]|nr:DUF1501 domain-containing protein [Verrucomicrobiota bacterium]